MMNSRRFKVNEVSGWYIPGAKEHLSLLDVGVPILEAVLSQIRRLEDWAARSSLQKPWRIKT